MAKKMMTGECDSDYVLSSSSSSSCMSSSSMMGKRIFLLRRLSTLRFWTLVIASIMIFIISVSSSLDNAEAKENNNTKTEAANSEAANESIAVRNRPHTNSLRQGGSDDLNLGTHSKQLTNKTTNKTDLNKLLREALDEVIETEKGCLDTLRKRCEELHLLPEELALLTLGSDRTIIKDIIYHQLNDVLLPELKEKFVFGDANEREMVLEQMKESLTESDADNAIMRFVNAQKGADGND